MEAPIGGSPRKVEAPDFNRGSAAFQRGASPTRLGRALALVLSLVAAQLYPACPERRRRESRRAAPHRIALFGNARLSYSTCLGIVSRIHWLHRQRVCAISPNAAKATVTTCYFCHNNAATARVYAMIYFSESRSVSLFVVLCLTARSVLVSTLRKQFNSPFIVEKSKLKRLIEVLDAKFTENGTSLKFEFEAHLSGQKVIETACVEEVLALDNSKRNRVERLVMNCAGTVEAEEVKRGLLIDFDGRTSATIYLAVRADNAAWAGEVFRVAEEQVERTLERSTMNLLSHNRASLSVFFSFALVLFMIVLFAGTSGNMVPSRLTNTMWLTEQDLKALEPLQSDPTLAREKAGEILSRQIRNVTLYRQQRSSILAWVIQWRFIVGITPPLFILAAFGYLYFKCYPNAVFLWGDAEAWYESLKQRRKAIWSGIIVAFGIGVLASLFVVAVASRN